MDSSSNVDDAVLESVLRLSLEEAAHREERLLDKSREGASLTTERYALQLQTAEMESALQSFRDARLARNLADGGDDEQVEVEQAHAQTSGNHADPMGSIGSTPSFDYDHDPFQTVDSPGRLTPDIFPEQDNDRCVACGTEIIGQEHMKAPCGHAYDFLCLSGLVQQAAIDEALFPPRCCKSPIPPDAFRELIPTGIWDNFEKKSIEYNTPTRDRRYCSWTMCSAFLGPVQTLDREVACPSCHSLICTSCRQPAHPSDTSCILEEDDSAAMIDHLLQENKWQRCPGCGAIVELTFGCNHMTCRCGSEFCYECAAGWKNCGCEVWNQQKLYAEAERRLNEEEAEWKANQQHNQYNYNYNHNDHPAGGAAGAGPSSLIRDLGNLRIYVPPAERRRARIVALADYLQNNHPCDHNWQQNPNGGRCRECERSVESSLMRCNRCYIAACTRCAFNRP